MQSLCFQLVHVRVAVAFGTVFRTADMFVYFFVLTGQVGEVEGGYFEGVDLLTILWELGDERMMVDVHKSVVVAPLF